MDIVDIFNAKIVDVSADAMVIEVTGHENKIDSLVRLLKDYDVVELVRTGRVSMVRGPQPGLSAPAGSSAESPALPRPAAANSSANSVDAYCTCAQDCAQL